MAKSEKRGPYKDGFYLEVHHQGKFAPVLIHRESEMEILQAKRLYEMNKRVVYLGEVREGKILATRE
jgi:hypothetical protein